MLRTTGSLRLIVLAALSFFLISCNHPSLYDDARQDYFNHHYSRAFEKTMQAAFQGDSRAQYALGNMYFYGTGTVKEPDLARYWIRRSAKNGYEPAIVALRIITEERYDQYVPLTPMTGHSATPRNRVPEKFYRAPSSRERLPHHSRRMSELSIQPVKSDSVITAQKMNDKTKLADNHVLCSDQSVQKMSVGEPQPVNTPLITSQSEEKVATVLPATFGSDIKSNPSLSNELADKSEPSDPIFAASILEPQSDMAVTRESDAKEPNFAAMISASSKATKVANAKKSESAKPVLAATRPEPSALIKDLKRSEAAVLITVATTAKPTAPISEPAKTDSVAPIIVATIAKPAAPISESVKTDSDAPIILATTAKPTAPISEPAKTDSVAPIIVAMTAKPAAPISQSAKMQSVAAITIATVSGPPVPIEMAQQTKSVGKNTLAVNSSPKPTTLIMYFGPSKIAKQTAMKATSLTASNSHLSSPISEATIPAATVSECAPPITVAKNSESTDTIKAARYSKDTAAVIAASMSQSTASLTPSTMSKSAEPIISATVSESEPPIHAATSSEPSILMDEEPTAKLGSMHNQKEHQIKPTTKVAHQRDFINLEKDGFTKNKIYFDSLPIVKHKPKLDDFRPNTFTWAMLQNPEDYTVQLTITRNPTKISKLANLQLPGYKVVPYKFQVGQKVKYSVTCGSFKSINEARKFVSVLPKNVITQAEVFRWKQLQPIMQPYA